MSRSLSVALLHPCFWPEVRRGGERIVRETSDGLLQRGHRPVLITSHPGPTIRSVEDGLPIVRLRRPPRPGLRPRAFPPYLTHVPLSYRALTRESFDIAHSFYPTDALASVAWARRTGRPAVLTYTGVAEPRWLASWRWGIEITRLAAAGSAAVIVLSQMAADAFERWLGMRPEVIYPGVDLELFSPRGARAPQPTILCAADASDPRKRVDLLVAAFAEVRRHRRDATLILARPHIAEVADHLARTEGVELFGPVERPADLAPIYRGAWASVLPSAGEAFGLVLAEALACGTPVVGSRLGAIPEVIDRPELGRLFDEEDPVSSLAEALLETLELAQDASVSEACRTRAQVFSMARNIDRYEALYRSLLAP